MNFASWLLSGIRATQLLNPLKSEFPIFRTFPPFSMDSIANRVTDGASLINTVQDVLVIGGGPAGLATATGVARQLYNTVVFDSGVYRNDKSHHMHNVPTWDHQDPSLYRAKAKKDLLARYNTIHFEDTAVESVQKTNDGLFKATDARGRTWMGKKLMLATGVRDIYPEIPGYGDVWAKGMWVHADFFDTIHILTFVHSYHCLFCHGYEDRGAPSAGVLAVGDIANPKVALHMAYMARRLANKVVVYTDGVDDLAEQISLDIKPGFNITVDRRSIERLSKGDGESNVFVHLAGGEQVDQGFLVHKPKSEVNGPFAQQLALELTDAGDIKISQPFGETSVPGVFAAGDCATFMKAVTQATAMGALGAGGLASQLQMLPPQKL